MSKAQSTSMPPPAAGFQVQKITQANLLSWHLLACQSKGTLLLMHRLSLTFDQSFQNKLHTALLSLHTNHLQLAESKGTLLRRRRHRPGLILLLAAAAVADGGGVLHLRVCCLMNGAQAVLVRGPVVQVHALVRPLPEKQRSGRAGQGIGSH